MGPPEGHAIHPPDGYDVALDERRGPLHPSVPKYVPRQTYQGGDGVWYRHDTFGSPGVPIPPPEGHAIHPPDGYDVALDERRGPLHPSVPKYVPRQTYQGGD